MILLKDDEVIFFLTYDRLPIFSALKLFRSLLNNQLNNIIGTTQVTSLMIKC